MISWMNNLSTAHDCDCSNTINGQFCLATVSGTLAIEPFAIVDVADGVIADLPSFNINSWLNKGAGRHLISTKL
jgi:hypothetical protein